jgi:hypothetical protein
MKKELFEYSPINTYSRRLSSDAGALLLREAERAVGAATAVASGCSQ